MLSIAHIINPVNVPQSSDLYIAQPITFETMKIAREVALKKVHVEQFAAVFPEDSKIVPQHLKKTRELTRSLLDFKSSDSQRKLPLIKEILDRLYEESNADYFIYTNVDIALMPHFYLSVKNIIEEGYDGFIINRRTISKIYSSISEIPWMFAEIGEAHPGSDCFVFKRDLYPKFHLGNVVIGCYFFGLTLRTNIAVFPKNFRHFYDLHLTFHIGDDRVWKNFTNDALHNTSELAKIFSCLMKNPDVTNKNRLSELYTSFLSRRKFLLEEIEERQSNFFSPEVRNERLRLPIKLKSVLSACNYNSISQIFSRRQSVVFISLHKCATTLFSRDVLPNIKGRILIDYQSMHYLNKTGFKIKTRKYGYTYGVIRVLDENHPSYEITNILLSEKNLANKKIIFLVRDPRDILVSMYYSFGFSHGFSPNPQIKDYQVKRSQRIQQLTLDEYAIQTAVELKEKFDTLSALMSRHRARNYIVLKFEDMVENFEYFYSQLESFVELNAGLADKLFKQTRPLKVEQLSQHKRKGKPGDYKVKLKQETIHEINAIFAKTLKDFGYSLE